MQLFVKVKENPSGLVVWFDSLFSSQHFFRYVGKGLSGLTSTKQE